MAATAANYQLSGSDAAENRKSLALRRAPVAGQQGAVTGVYLHGLLENTAYRQWWLEALGWRGQAQDWQARLEAELDRVAGEVSACWPGM